jgi:choline dehydrogenase-like flavoprotein
MGGGFASHALAQAGRDVLLIDYGNENIPDGDGQELSDRQEQRIAEGKWPTLSAFEVDGVIHRRYPPFGVGVGGSANWYAAALERFDNCDIDSQAHSRHVGDGWPISYDDLLPYYERAEKLLHVCGTPDPLNTHPFDHISEPPPLGPLESDLFHFFQEKGTHPYRLHVGIRYRQGCDECLGRMCHKGCRTDVRSVLAESPKKPTIMARSKVVKLEATSDRVTHAIVIQGEKRITVHAKVFVLAAGAIQSPKLLLQSRNDHWPDGLANRSGLVGRNLMFHAQLAFALWPRKRSADTGPRKSLAFRDFYEVGGQRLGSVQSTGLQLGYGEYLMHLYRRFDLSRVRRLRFVRPLLRVPALATIKSVGPGTIFVCIIEDMPYPENRIVLDENEADGVRLKYTIKNELRHRGARFRKILTERLKGRRMVFILRDIELNYGHPCGTCVMSNDPSTGVTDRNCRAHGVANLFIADASFMPTSAACNPALTIAANALRVSGAIDQLLTDTPN